MGKATMNEIIDFEHPRVGDVYISKGNPFNTYTATVEEVRYDWNVNPWVKYSLGSWWWRSHFTSTVEKFLEKYYRKEQ